MTLGKFIGKIITVPLKIVAMPIRIIGDVANSDNDSLIKTVTDSIEKQTEEIMGKEKQGG